MVVSVAASMSVSAFAETKATHDNGTVSVSGYEAVDNAVQYTVIVFKVADAESLLIIDLKDLKSMINHVVENKDKYEDDYGYFDNRSAHGILRSLLTLEDQGGNEFFG